MTQYDDEMKGVLFKNPKKTKDPEDKRPDYEGHVIVGGNKLWLSAWLRKSKQTGKTFMSLALKVAQPQGGQGTVPAQAAPVQAPPVVQPTPDEDIPF